MPPDRRFGLPHPLDPETSDATPGRRTGLWESLKRALGAPAPEPSGGSGAVRRADPEPPLPGMPPPRPPVPPPARVEPPVSTAPKQSSAEPAPPPPAVAIPGEVPFLSDAEEAAPPPGPPPPAPAASPSFDPSPEVPAASGTPASPRLARGLASFSKSNAEREKRFAHLIRDGDSSKKKR